MGQLLIEALAKKGHKVHLPPAPGSPLPPQIHTWAHRGAKSKAPLIHRGESVAQHINIETDKERLRMGLRFLGGSA